MDAHLVATRRSLHGVAELVIAGPQYRRHGEIRLRATPGGFGGVDIPVRVEGVELVWPGARAEVSSTCRELAAAARLDVGVPGIYAETSGVDPDEPLTVDAGRQSSSLTGSSGATQRSGFWLRTPSGCSGRNTSISVSPSTR